MRPQAVQGFWNDSDGRRWYVRLYFLELDGRAECVGMEMRSFRWPQEASYTEEGEHAGSLLVQGSKGLKPTPLRAEVLRAFRLGSQIEETKRSQAAFRRWWAGWDQERDEELEAAADRWERRSPKGGRPKLPVEFYATVAEVYRRAWANREPPTEAVRTASELRPRTPVSKSTAANWVARARQLGFLGPTTKGKPGGVRPSEGEEE